MPATRTSIHRLVVGLALTVSLGGCAANVKDVTSSIVQTILPIPDGSFKHVAWLSDDLVVFVYSSKRDAKPSDFALGFYDLDTQEFRIETPPTTSKCFSIMLGWLAKLPDGRLGVVSSCNFFGSQTTYEANTLYARSLDSSDYTPLQQYPNDFHAKDYTFSPDMKRWIQSTLGYEFYEYQADGSFSRILQEYVRVTSPAWSESGDTIAFAGIRNDSDLGQVLVDETSLWTLYLMDSSDGDSRPLLGGVRFVWYLKWSPGHDCLSFRGEYQGLLGIWVLNAKSQVVMRVWADESFYDWSSDGVHMIIVERLKRLEVDGVERTRPVMIDLPEELCDNAR